MPGAFGPLEDFEAWFSAPLDALGGKGGGGKAGGGSSCKQRGKGQEAGGGTDNEMEGGGGDGVGGSELADGAEGAGLTEEEFMLATNRLHQVGVKSWNLLNMMCWGSKMDREG